MIHHFRLPALVSPRDIDKFNWCWIIERINRAHGGITNAKRSKRKFLGVTQPSDLYYTQPSNQ
ncbi:predicted protein [Botrytis cinerea T4]|uniref:Uncharacterized protein n=1 Tax=Botryotinia fuckeliana (strain T4) TaxID=999810 RepID=G2YE64_BOTF4|nr:predicted protein [Botrytis cinerea T4]